MGTQSCKYCDNEGMDAPLEGRIFKMEKHLSKCSAYIERNNTGIGHCSTNLFPTGKTFKYSKDKDIPTKNV